MLRKKLFKREIKQNKTNENNENENSTKKPQKQQHRTTRRAALQLVVNNMVGDLTACLVVYERINKMPRPKNSALYSYFLITMDKQAICRNENCDNKILNSHPGNLERHLKKIHPLIFECYLKKKLYNDVLTTNIKREVLNDSSVSDGFTTSFNSETTPAWSSAINKEHIQMALVELFTKCGRPLSLAEDRPFKMLVTPTLESLNMKVDEHNVITLITQYSNNIKNEVKEELCGRLISLKIDGVTVNSKNALTEIAFVVLAIPCTQVSVERLYSAIEYIQSDQLNKPSSTNLEHILLVRANGNFSTD
ncbi:hypothetical protein FF38_02300 [Lucilia cuprina]|uniref:Uncharacterized protein n=1 Tax=Lucilia cuprina TaxID=7375 RepID=A0A0L0C6F0_LUCCU|nr:hypothetical protein FF38_02300 [Lucilia cuprina]